MANLKGKNNSPKKNKRSFGQRMLTPWKTKEALKDRHRIAYVPPANMDNVVIDMCQASSGRNSNTLVNLMNLNQRCKVLSFGMLGFLVMMLEVFVRFFNLRCSRFWTPYRYSIKEKDDQKHKVVLLSLFNRTDIPVVMATGEFKPYIVKIIKNCNDGHRKKIVLLLLGFVKLIMFLIIFWSLSQ